MADVDDKIVSMKFDNVAFERNLGETIRSLEKLRQSLNFTDSTKGMNELKAASNNFNMHGMSSAVEGVSGKFLALTTVALTSLATITHSAITAGARIVKGLSIAPVMDGFREYETNINSIQTILANTDSKGTKLEDVNKALDQLNHYADQTIYNFSEMTRNIGTFTAAGVDLDTSVASIKGIANIAAISGSNSEQASTAMYQLSQALASGTVKLMDWNSVVNAGMGGEVFQKALFEAGKAAGTLTDVPVGQTFEQWKNAGNTFRGSLEKGWLTAEVLTKTLKGFTGDLTEAQIMAMGYTKEQAAEVMRLGKIGKAAATEVKTFTQLMGTIKEAVGSGWATSFRILVGDFEQAKKLFTGLSNTIGGFVGRTADTRNEMLKGWAELGGRDTLLQGLENSLIAIGRVLGPIGAAFRDVFPATTAKRLFELTQAFANLTAKLSISYEAGQKIRDIFRGVFSVIDIGKTIVIEFLKFLGGIIGSLSGVGGGALDLAAKFGVMLQVLNNFLVGEGNIHKFFVALGEVIKKPIEFIQQLTSVVAAFFRGFSGSDQVEAGMDRLENRFDSLGIASKRLGDIWDRLSNALEGVKRVFEGVWEYIRGWFSELGARLAEAFRPGDFNAAVDIVNVGLLGGIALMIKKFVSGGFLDNIGGGIFEKVSGALDQLTGTLKAMQANVRADTLMKIAIAVGVLTASVLVLSTINSVALTTALVAMSVGFGQMVGVLAVLNTLTAGPMSAAKIGVLTAALILLATAMVIFSVAIKNLSSLSWSELVKGLIGVGVGLGIMVAAIHLLPPTPGLIATGIAMSAVAVALLLLSTAVKSFSEMSWAELAKGLVGVAVGLGLLTLAMNFIPPGMISAGLGLIAVAVALRILAEAVSAFGNISWGEMLKGLTGIGLSLVIIAGAMHLMPPHMILMATGLLVLSVALNVMAKAVQVLGSLSISEMAKGLGALAAMLLILAIGVNAMTGALAGAAALVVVSGALLVLSTVLAILGNMKLSTIATGIGSIAAVLIVLGVAAAVLTPVIPMLYSLGAAIALLGAGFALFGVGAMLVAKAFEFLARAGRTGVMVLIDVIKMLIMALPELVGAFIKSLAELAGEILAAAPLLLRLVTALLLQILDTVIELVPKIGEAFAAFVTTALRIIREHFPDLLQTGFLLLMELLRGIRDNIGEITTLGVDIVVNFVLALINNINRLVDAGIQLLTAFLNSISNRIGEVVEAGVNVLVNLVIGIAGQMFRVIDAVTSIVITFVTQITESANQFVTAGADSLIRFIEGISNNITKVIDKAVDIIVAFVGGLADNAFRIINAAADLVLDFLNGLATVIRERTPEFFAAGRNIVGAIIDGMLAGLRDTPVIGRAIDMARGIVGAVKNVFEIFSPSKVFRDIGRNVVSSLGNVFKTDKTAENSAVVQAERIIKAFEESLNRVPKSIAGLGDITPIITPVLDLTKVQLASKTLDSLLAVSQISPEVSFDRAKYIATTRELEESIREEAQTYTGPAEVRFEQNIYSPEALSTNDIYRNTKSQIALAKEELGIL